MKASSLRFKFKVSIYWNLLNIKKPKSKFHAQYIQIKNVSRVPRDKKKLNLNPK